MYAHITDREEELGREIVDAAYKVHRELGPGLLEKIYEAVFVMNLGRKESLIKDKKNCPFFMTGRS